MTLETQNNITETIFLNASDPSGDIAIVLGNSNCEEPAKVAINLYKSKKCNKILFSGGYNEWC